MRIMRVIILVILGMLGSSACPWSSLAFPEKAPDGTIGATDESTDDVGGRAVSLRVLQTTLKECFGRNEYPEDLIHFCGITRIMGYVVDARNNDIILFGPVVPGAPPLHVEDFALALRNAWWMYAPVEGNTRYYSYPYCSIDPDPHTVAALNAVGRRLHRPDVEDIDSVLADWRSTCGQLQKVSVGGILQQTRFASVMVEADYSMKRLVDGSETLSTVKGFSGLVDMALERMKEEARTGRQLSSPHPFNRFEFCPGENIFSEGDSIVYLRKSEVTLVTEEQFLATSGKVVGNNRADPFAQRFAQSFTSHYAEIAKEKPIYAELEGLFRHVAIAKAWKSRNVPAAAGLDLDVLIGHLPIRAHEVPESLPGVANVKEFSQRDEKPDGYSEYHLWLPSCGGVQIGIDVTKKSFETVRRRVLNGLRKAIFDARPGTNEVSWNFKAQWIGELLDGVAPDFDPGRSGGCALPRS